MKKLESGRSMVEMLGVLAIIGVLSIGGIAGYVLSMNRYRANNLIDLASKYASLAYTANATAEAFNKTKPTSSNFAFSDAGLGTIDSTESIVLKSVGKTTGTGSAATTDPKVVVVDVTFQSKDVCGTAATILGLADTCTSKGTLTIDFKQN